MFDFSLLGTRTTHYQTQLLPGQPVTEQVGVGSRESATNNPLAFKANAALSWTKGALTLGWNTQYFHSYWLNATHTLDPFQGSVTVPRQVYHDVFGRWSGHVYVVDRQAATTLEKAVALDPEQTMQWQCLAQARSRLNEREAAVAAQEKAIALYEKSPRRQEEVVAGMKKTLAGYQAK